MSLNNDGKSTTWRIIDVALILVLGLIGTVWAITWRATDKKAEKACVEVQLTREFIAAQKEINKNMNEKLEEILREVRK
jgi:hypothetical protein